MGGPGVKIILIIYFVPLALQTSGGWLTKPLLPLCWGHLGFVSVNRDEIGHVLSVEVRADGKFQLYQGFIRHYSLSTYLKRTGPGLHVIVIFV